MEKNHGGNGAGGRPQGGAPRRRKRRAGTLGALRKALSAAFPEKRKSTVATDSEMIRRSRTLKVLLVVLFVAVIGFVGKYAIIEREYWQQQAVEQQLSDTTLSAKRGTIYDAKMEKLVVSATAWKISIRKNLDPELVGDEPYGCLRESDKDAVVKKLAEVTGLSEEYINNRLSLKASDIQLRGKINKEQKDALMEFVTDENNKVVIPGITLTTDTKRYYYRGTLASTVLGFTNDSNEGASGLEQKYDDTLAGVPGRIVSAKAAASGESMPFDYKMMVDPTQGNSVVLTIDATVQQYLEKYLKQAVRDNDVRNRACGIIMRVNTGEILAMATVPDYDPSNYQTIADPRTAKKIEALEGKEKTEAVSAAQNAQWKNKAITDTYEPGSVFKPITMAASLEEGITSVGESFKCPGYKVVAGRRIGCHRAGGHGNESLTQGMMNSCNPVFMTLALRLGATKFHRYFTAFGLTEITGVDLPGEASGVAHTEKALASYDGNLAVSAFGQTFKVTPMQMITAISAVTNGGYLVRPHIVSQILDSEDNIVERVETTVKRQVISENTSKTINTMLEKTVSGGTAKNGYIKGYRIGGKTGTSEKIEEEDRTGVKSYVASYCAIAPSDSPEIAMLILLDEPHGTSHTGGSIAAPVVRNVLGEVLPYLGIETIYSTSDAELLDTLAPSVVGRTLDEAKSSIGAKGLKYRVLGDGDTIIAQIPQGGRSLPKGSTIVLSTESSDMPMTTVPDLAGLSPSKANRAVSNAKLNIRYAGSGYDSSLGEVVGQSIDAGAKVEQGTVITVEFIQSGSTD